MILKIPKCSFSAILVIIPVLYFNSCTFEFVKHYFFVLPIVIMCILGWLLFLSYERIRLEVYSMLPMIGYTLIMIVMMLLDAQNKIESFASDFRNILYLLFFMCVFVIYSKPEHRKERRFIVFVCILDAVISCLYSVYRLIKDPNLSRLLSTGSYHGTSEAARARGIISFGVVYGLVLICTVLLFLIVNDKNKRGLNLCLFFIFAIALAFAQFTMAILLVTVSAGWILYMNKQRTQTKLFYLVLFGGVGLFILPPVLEWIAMSNLFGYEVNVRLVEISSFFIL